MTNFLVVVADQQTHVALTVSVREGPALSGKGTFRGTASSYLSPGWDEGDIRYVQHRLWDHREHVLALIDNGAHVYVCGDAAGMGTAVEETLRRIGTTVSDDQDGSRRTCEKRDTTRRTCTDPVWHSAADKGLVPPLIISQWMRSLVPATLARHRRTFLGGS